MFNFFVPKYNLLSLQNDEVGKNKYGHPFSFFFFFFFLSWNLKVWISQHSYGLLFISL
jgi:hypothetical protein